MIKIHRGNYLVIVRKTPKNCQVIAAVAKCYHANVTFCDIPCDTVSILSIINAMRGLGQECRFERMVTA